MRISDWSSDVCSSDLPSGAFGVHSVPGTTPYPGASGDANDLVWETPPAGRQAVLWTDDARDLRTAFCGSYGRWFDFRCRVPAALFPAYSRRVHSPISLNEEGHYGTHIGAGTGSDRDRGPQAGREAQKPRRQGGGASNPNNRKGRASADRHR